MQTVQSSSAESNGTGRAIFTPSAALIKAKQSGVAELSIVLEFLDSLGLQYTASVLRLEAGLAAVPLLSTADLHQRFGVASLSTCLTALVQGGGHVDVQASPAQPAAVAGEPAAQRDAAAAAAADTSDNDGAASDHNQPGGEDTTFFISRWTKRHFVRYQQVSGQQVQLDRLMDCQTVVLDELDSMTADDCEGGELVIAACEGSVFLRNCKNMTVHVACKQLRTRDCANIDLHIFTTTDPVVEMSHHVNFYPFHLRLPGLRKLFAEARLDAKLNRFVHVYDFTPSEPNLPQPHFLVHFPDHQQTMEDRYATYGTPECPPELEQLLALQLMPAASSESGKNKSYDIKTGAQVWAKAGTAAAAAVPTATAAAATDLAITAAAGKPAATAYKDDFDASESEHSSVHSSSVSDVKSDSNSRDDDDDDDDDDSHDTHAKVSQQKQKEPAVAATTTTTAAAAAAGHAATPGGLDNEEYSSFDDESDDAHNADDKYEVDEDEDDF